MGKEGTRRQFLALGIASVLGGVSCVAKGVAGKTDGVTGNVPTDPPEATKAPEATATAPSTATPIVEATQVPEPTVVENKARIGAVDQIGTGTSELVDPITKEELEGIAVEMGPGITIYHEVGLVGGTIGLSFDGQFEGRVAVVPQSLNIGGKQYERTSMPEYGVTFGVPYITKDGERIYLGNEWKTFNPKSRPIQPMFYQDEIYPDEVFVLVALEGGGMIRGRTNKVNRSEQVTSGDENVKDIVAKMGVIDASINPEAIAALPTNVAIEAWLKGKIRPGVDQGILNVDSVKYRDGTVRFGIVHLNRSTVDDGRILAENASFPMITLGTDKPGQDWSETYFGATSGAGKPVVIVLKRDDMLDVGVAKGLNRGAYRSVIGEGEEALRDSLGSRRGQPVGGEMLVSFDAGIYLESISTIPKEVADMEQDPAYTRQSDKVQEFMKFMLWADIISKKHNPESTVEQLAQRAIEFAASYDYRKSVYNYLKTGNSSLLPKGALVKRAGNQVIDTGKMSIMFASETGIE